MTSQPNQPPEGNGEVAGRVALGCLGGLGITLAISMCILASIFFFIMAVCSR